MNNIITVTFGALKSVKTCPAWLVDHGMILRFAGLDLPTAYEVHFSNSKTAPAKTAIGDADGVVIPDEYFHGAERIYAWLYLHTGEDDGWTAYEVEIPLRQRPEVSDVPPTPQQETAIEQAITALNAAVEQTGEDVVTTAAAVQAAEAAQEAAETAQTAAETAKTQAQTAQGKAEQAKAGAEYAAENAYLYAANAATAQAAAETAQGGAVSAKTSAETAASNASGYATAAQQSATAAANSATSASGSATAAGNSATAASGSATSANEAKVASQAAQAAAEAAAAALDDLDAGDVAYDASETYPSGTTGAAISNKQDAPPTPGTAGQVLGLDSSLNPVWLDQTGGGGGGDDCAPVIIDSASGDIASFPDGTARPVVGLTVGIEPVQDLHGQANPWPGGGNKNLWNPDTSETGYYDASGNLQPQSPTSLEYVSDFIPVEPQKSYYIKYFKYASGESYWTSITWFDSSKNFIYRSSGSTNPYITVLSPESAAYARAGCRTYGHGLADGCYFGAGSSGDFSPYSNLCPITGHTGTDVKHSYKVYGDYQRVEYLQSNGDQYIKTGIIPDNALGYDLDFMALSPVDPSNYGCVMGGRVASVTKDFQVTTFSNTPTLFLGTIRGGNSQDVFNAGIVQDTRQTVSLRNRISTNASGETKTFNTIDWDGAQEIYFFGLNNKGVFAQSGSGCRIYGCKFYDGNTLIHDFIPVKRVSDGAAGMYETVTGQFLTNAGSGSFTTGPLIANNTVNVEWEDEAGTVYVGSENATTGKLTVTFVKKAVTTFSGVFGATDNGYAAFVQYSDCSHTVPVGVRDSMLSNIFQFSSSGYSSMPLYSYCGSSGAVETFTFILPPSVTSLAEANAWLSENPTECTFMLKNPLEFDLTPSQFETAYGQNDIWSTTGDVAVTYRADTKLYIDKKLAALAAQIVNS